LNGITNCVLLDEPPCTDPYARWCERGRLAAAPYSITSRGMSWTAFVQLNND
jgi:hypothetical protein